MSILARKRVLFNYAFMGFIALTVFGGGLLAQLKPYDFDNGSAVSTPVNAEKIEKPEKQNTEIASAYAGQPKVAKAPAAGSASTTKNVSFNQAVREIPFKSGSTYCTQYDAGTGIIHCSGTGFYFAHRAYAFGRLASVNIGDSITVDGRTYTVTSKFQRAVTSKDMNSIIYSGHAISLMTCAGPNDSERLVVFAD